VGGGFPAFVARWKSWLMLTWISLVVDKPYPSILLR
jgi:uncharacterized membrane protein